jgi:hypothetical protein
MRPSSHCPSCGTPASGNFCRACGAPTGSARCARCQAPLSQGAAFCAGCGTPTGSSKPPSAGHGAWYFAAAAILVVLGIFVFSLSRSPVAAIAAAPPAAPAAGQPPDISGMSPRERFDRLYDRVMKAAQSGDAATAAQFTPMALEAYAQLDTIDADARYHAALLKAHAGDLPGTLALADTMLARSPGNLLAYMVRGSAARFGRDDAALRRAYTDFLGHYDVEMKKPDAGYAEHHAAIEDFRTQAAAARGTR